MRLTSKTINAILIGVIIFELSFLTGLFIIYKNNRPNSPISKEFILPDGRLSYDYLKSVTVYINGEGVAEQEFLGIKLGKAPIAWAGTGIIVKIDDEYTYILTNSHMVGRLKEEPVEEPVIYVNNENRKQVAEILKVSELDDMALIRIEGTIPSKRVINGFATAHIQDKVYMVGQSLGDPFIYSEGCMAGYYTKWNLFLLTTMPGNSGSGVFNSDGNLVGLIFAGRGITPFQMDVNYGIAIDSSVVKQFLKSGGI
jgi:S1-C subfamily serine protease